MEQIHVFFAGTVQGVGFRYTVLRMAEHLKLVGWVRNLADGRVEMEAQGAKSDLEELLKRIDARYEGFLRNKIVNWVPITGQYLDFQIQH